MYPKDLEELKVRSDDGVGGWDYHVLSSLSLPSLGAMLSFPFLLSLALSLEACFLLFLIYVNLESQGNLHLCVTLQHNFF